MRPILLLILFLNFSNAEAYVFQGNPSPFLTSKNDTIKRPKYPIWIVVKRDIQIKNYFKFIDSIVKSNDSMVAYTLSEHLLIHANPWIIETLANTDYYRMMEKDLFVYDQKSIVVLKAGDSLKIPDFSLAETILKGFETIRIDVNIPEFKLRIYQDSVLLYTFPIRVGQNRQRYLAFGNRITDLRTKQGTGKIIRYERYPDFYNPVNGKQFYVTKRDDYKVTVMPQIPWIETEINGIRNGQMIHPTTNPRCK